MPSALDDVPSLALFLDVVEAGSFARAARTRGLTTSAVSKRIAHLEDRVGLRLLHRTTRRLAPTDAGRTLALRAERVLGALHDAEHDLAELAQAPRGVLRVATSVGLARSHVGRVVSDFVAAHGEVSIELEIDEAIVDLVAGHFDVAVRCGAMPDSSLTTRRIARARRVLCASPKYLTEKGTPARASDLAEHVCLRHALGDGGTTWRLGPKSAPEEVRVRGGFHANDPFVVRDAAVAGLGVAFLPSFVVADDVRAGRLNVLLPQLATDTGAVYVVLPPNARPSPLTRAFVDHVASAMAAALA